MKRLAASALNLAIVATMVFLAAAELSVVRGAPVEMNAVQKAGMLLIISNSPEIGLVRRPGMTPEALKKILAFREQNDEFESIEQIRTVSGLTSAQFEVLRKSFTFELPSKEFMTSTEGSAVERESAPGKGLGDRKAGLGIGSKKSKLGTPAKELEDPTKLNLSVRPHFYYDLPGIDTASLTDAQRTAFLEMVNRELCSCGCKGETLGYCYVNDPGCAVIKARVKKLFREFSKSGNSQAKPSSR